MQWVIVERKHSVGIVRLWLSILEQRLPGIKGGGVITSCVVGGWAMKGFAI